MNLLGREKYSLTEEMFPGNRIIKLQDKLPRFHRPRAGFLNPLFEQEVADYTYRGQGQGSPRMTYLKTTNIELV